MTNLQLVTSALKMLGVLHAGETPAIEDGTLALDELNALMAFLASDGINVGYYTQTSLTDDVPLSDETAQLVKPQLAVWLQTSYPSTSYPPSLAARAVDCKRQMLRGAVLANIQEADMSNIPGGEARGGVGSILTG
jgi:hypothetical protein